MHARAAGMRKSSPDAMVVYLDALFSSGRGSGGGALIRWRCGGRRGLCRDRARQGFLEGLCQRGRGDLELK